MKEIRQMAMVKNTIAIIANNARCLKVDYRLQEGLCFQHLEQDGYVDDFVLHLDVADSIWLLQKLRSVMIENRPGSSRTIIRCSPYKLEIRYTAYSPGFSIKVKSLKHGNKIPIVKVHYLAYAGTKSVLDSLSDCLLKILKEA